MTILLSIFFLFSQVQPKTGLHKTYAYVQNISGGAHRVITDDSGNIIEEGPSSRKIYFIYMEIKKGSLKVDSLKIENNTYRATTEKTKTPVFKLIQPLMHTKEKHMTLVPLSNNSVYRIYPQQVISTITDKRNK